MKEAIDPVNLDLRLAQLLGEDSLLAQSPAAPAAASPSAPAPAAGSKVEFSGNPFEDILSKAVDALDGVSQSEIYANQLIDKYLRGEVELQDVMVVQSKMSIMVQLAITTINTAVNTFKEITQIQV